MLPDNDEKLSPRARRVDKWDRKLGMLWYRFWALVVGSAGLALLLWYFTSVETMAVGSMIFVTIVGLVLLFVARLLWRNNEGISALLDDPDFVERQPGKHKKT